MKKSKKEFATPELGWNSRQKSIHEIANQIADYYDADAKGKEEIVFELATNVHLVFWFMETNGLMKFIRKFLFKNFPLMQKDWNDYCKEHNEKVQKAVEESPQTQNITVPGIDASAKPLEVEVEPYNETKQSIEKRR